MSSSKITLIGFYKFMDSLGQDIFNELVLPAGIDKTTLTDNILLKGGEFEVIYSDPEFLQKAIGTWSNKWNRTFTKWITALEIEYNPLENYDRIEKWEENSSENESTQSSASSQDSTSGTGSSNTIDKVSAFNSSSLENDTSSDTSTSNTATSSSTISNDAGRTNEVQNIRTGRTHGNVGVTTSQQMLQSELDIATWNIYEHITDIFLSEFVIPIY